MSWQLAETLPWQEPLALAAQHAGVDMALLYSGLHEEFTGKLSYLFLNPLEEKSGDDWAQLPPLPSSTDGLPLWVGYLGYGMREDDTHGDKSPVSLPDFRLVRYGALFRFDHEQQLVSLYQSTNAQPVATPHTTYHAPLTVFKLASNLTRAEYEQSVAATIERIHAGDFYQANITRKFFGEFDAAPDSFALFAKLCEASPAPYSAYIRHGSSAILSSSPECFLSVDASGVMTTRPIKGSARRVADEAEDTKIRAALATSTKNHAENLMIVDLMRNDLSRASESMSVEVIEQSKLYSYRTIHHLISTIRAKKRADVSAYDAVRACFPAGSMTGAPKIAAMQWCAAQEKLERGVYSGAIGWFGGGDTCDLSVVIRTLIIDGNRFEFQVGGGIVADSTPEDEWRETLTKARGILAALGLSEADVAAL